MLKPMRATQQIASSPRSTPSLLQPRLTIGPVDDPYEREAERVADQVLRMPAPNIQRAPVDLTPDWLAPLSRRNGRGAGGEGQLQRCAKCAGKPIEEMCPNCAAKAQANQGLVQRSADGATPEMTPAIEGQIQGLRGGGQPLDGEIRSFMEPRFGYDFGGVRVHTGPQAARAASSVSALAFTLGNDVVFGAGQYQPGSENGKRLIAHELTHVVQQDNNFRECKANINSIDRQYYIQCYRLKGFPATEEAAMKVAVPMAADTVMKCSKLSYWWRLVLSRSIKDMRYDYVEDLGLCGWTFPASWYVEIGKKAFDINKCCDLASTIAHEVAHTEFTTEGKSRGLECQCFGCSC